MVYILLSYEYNLPLLQIKGYKIYVQEGRNVAKLICPLEKGESPDKERRRQARKASRVVLYESSWLVGCSISYCSKRYTARPCTKRNSFAKNLAFISYHIIE
jgi:hypothetical protein